MLWNAVSSHHFKNIDACLTMYLCHPIRKRKKSHLHKSVVYIEGTFLLSFCTSIGSTLLLGKYFLGSIFTPFAKMISINSLCPLQWSLNLVSQRTFSKAKYSKHKYFSCLQTYLEVSSVFETNTTLTPPTLPGGRIVCNSNSNSSNNINSNNGTATIMAMVVESR